MKKVLSFLLIVTLLYQAGGFALLYLSEGSDREELILSDAETVTVKIPISLPYSEARIDTKEVAGQVRSNDEFYQMIEQKMQNDTLYTTMKVDHSARENFYALADMVNQHLTDTPSKSDQKSSLIQLLVKEYCANNTPWVLYLMEWPLERSNSGLAILATTDFHSSFFSPPQV